MKDSLKDQQIVWDKLLKLMEQQRSFGIFVYRALYFGDYNAVKRAIWGVDGAYRNSSIVARFFFAQFVISKSKTISYLFDTVRRRLIMKAGQKANLQYSGNF